MTDLIAPGIGLGLNQAISIAESNYRVNVWEGAIRSGKTFSSQLRWLMYIAGEAPSGGQLLMVGRTRDSLYRNVIAPMQDPEVFGDLADQVRYTSGAPYATILGKRVHVLGAHDSKAEKAIRGMTLAGAYGDEATILSEHFFTQLLGRMSVDGAKAFFTTNPDSPSHWLKEIYLDRINDPINPLQDWGSWHFGLDDNPKMKALMVLTWGQPLNVWSKEVGATVISDGVPDFYQGGMLPALPEAAVEILSSCGQIINHNNTITGGYEKRDVKRALDELKMRGLINEIDRDSVVEWAAANGWLWGNPKILGEYVEKYQSGRTIRV